MIVNLVSVALWLFMQSCLCNPISYSLTDVETSSDHYDYQGYNEDYLTATSPFSPRAYYFNETPANQREAHQFEPNKPVTPKELESLGVVYLKIDSTDYLDEINEICLQRNYKNRDIVTISPSMPQYQEKLKSFFTEHLHEDEEIRFIIEGSGYFDIRDKNDQWIRIHLQKSDLIVLPAGIYHRFTPDTNDYTKAMRLFKDDPKWTPLNRSIESDALSVRKEYVESLQ